MPPKRVKLSLCIFIPQKQHLCKKSLCKALDSLIKSFKGSSTHPRISFKQEVLFFALSVVGLCVYNEVFLLMKQNNDTLKMVLSQTRIYIMVWGINLFVQETLTLMDTWWHIIILMHCEELSKVQVELDAEDG